MTLLDHNSDHAIAEIARGQFGAFARQQAREVGLTRRQIAYRIGVKRWEVLHPGVYRLAGTPDSRALTAVGALLYAGRQACFSHAASARLHGFEPCLPDRWVWLTVPEFVQRPFRPGLKIVRSRRIEGFTTVVHGQPVLSVERTVVDLAGVLDEIIYQRMLYDVITRRITTADAILAAAEDFGGKCGTALVRRAIATYDPAFESGLEREADELFRSVGLVFQRQVEIWENRILLARLDFADEALKFGIEVDGARYHSSMLALEYDRERDRSLRRRGWHIERLTTVDVRQRPAATQRHLLEIHSQRQRQVRMAS